MRLRNKKTGEINFGDLHLDDFNSLAELNAEWEDVEEPIGYWYISEEGIPGRINFSWDSKESIENHKEIGNYFDTYLEAEKAVEKLKAWKRLEEAGAEFYGWRRNQTGTYELYMRWYDRIPRSYEVKKDLDLLFSEVKND